ncbi:hypothetical protein ACGF5C_12510 [Micromonospora sp. NPDC047620]|uniref:hypothetical protein n=1 Tax=Micromonospora sp. NPDC047620 TaxID=3364251 RepID=UPI0037195205
MVGQHGAQGGHRRPVVAVLGVVVVLDDQAAGPGPRRELAAAVAAEHHAGRELVGRGEQHATAGRCWPGRR